MSIAPTLWGIPTPYGLSPGVTLIVLALMVAGSAGFLLLGLAYVVSDVAAWLYDLCASPIRAWWWRRELKRWARERVRMIEERRARRATIQVRWDHRRALRCAHALATAMDGAASTPPSAPTRRRL